MLWAEKGKAAVLVGGSFGSCGKGQIAAWLSNHSDHQINIATCNSGAQAGHTTRHRGPVGAREYVCYHLPTHAVEDSSTLAYLNAGSIIDAEALAAEITACGVDPHQVRIHPNATLITEDDRRTERAIGSSTMRLGSTMKGVGSAIANKVMRRATLVGQSRDEFLQPLVQTLRLNNEMKNGAAVVVEVPQGFGLSINHGWQYPYSTSRDCWVGSGLSDAGIHPSFLGQVCMVVRTKPIRVGHFYNEMGEKLGDSGPFYPGSVEMDWARDLPGVEPERTTVTKRVRRIASWSDRQYYEALVFNRPSIVALTFCDYLAGIHEFEAQLARMDATEKEAGVKPDRIYSFGPYVDDVTAALSVAYNRIHSLDRAA